MNKSDKKLAPMHLPKVSSQSAYGLAIVNDLLNCFHKEKISYCHWKSNEHVLEGMLGKTDLDILVDRNEFLKVNQALSKTGFKRFLAKSALAYPAVEDYLAMDSDTGKLVHLHLHYQLVAGEEHLKGYHLPWEHLALSHRQFAAEKNIYVIDPNLEIILLIVRAALKLRTRDLFLVCLGKPYLKNGMLVELNWLRERIELEKVHKLAQKLLGEEVAPLLNKIITDQISLRQLITVRNTAMPTLKLYRTYNRLEAAGRRWLRELIWLVGVLNKRYLHFPTPLRRTDPNGGHMIAFLGCDGSGKSTLVREVINWLSWKIDVLPVYFGSGDGSSSLLRWPMRLASDLLHNVPGLKSDQHHISDYSQSSHGASQGDPWLKAILKIPWALTLAYEKRSKFHRAKRARNSGMIVVCDRYPQNQVMGFNDGPLLSHWFNHRFGLLRAIARWESAPYCWSEIYFPNLVIKLHVTPEVALQRKKDMSIEENCRRVAAIKSLHYSPAAKIIDIDANEPLHEVLLKVKQCIWQEL